jgi:hypothetical protein
LSDKEWLDGLMAIKDFIDEEGQMSWSYFRRRLLPELKEAVLIEKCYAEPNECKYKCLKTTLSSWIIKRRKL